jgi:hypothetical protein
LDFWDDLSAAHKRTTKMPIPIGSDSGDALGASDIALIRLNASDPATTPEQVLAILKRDGAVIVRGLISAAAAHQVSHDVFRSSDASSFTHVPMFCRSTKT